MTQKKRKAYEKPAVISQKILETAALACGKCLGNGPISQLACKNRNRTS